MSPRRRNKRTPKGAGKLPASPAIRKDLFAREYVQDFNGTQAAKRVGYTPKGAAVASVRLLKDVHVQAKIRALVEDRCRRLGLNAEDVLGELAAMATSSMTDFLNLDAPRYHGPALPEGAEPWEFKHLGDVPEKARKAVKKLSFIRAKDGSTRMEIELYDKHGAARTALEHLGLLRSRGKQHPDASGSMDTNGATDAGAEPGGVQGKTPPAENTGPPQAVPASPLLDAGGRLHSEVELTPAERRQRLAHLLSAGRLRWVDSKTAGGN